MVRQFPAGTGRRRVATSAIATLLSCAALAAACSGGDEGDDSADAGPAGTDQGVVDTSAMNAAELEAAVEQVAPEDTLVWVTGAEPADLHLDATINGLPEAVWIREGLLESLFGVGSNLTYYPELLAAEPTVTTADDGTVTIDYRLRSDLRWSDGVPLTADDVAYTHRIMTEGCEVEFDGSIVDASSAGCVYLTPNRSGLDQVTSFDVVNDTEFTVTLAGAFSDWRSLYNPVLAAHGHGDDAAEVNRRLATMAGPDGPLPVSGPLQLVGWNRGQAMTMIGNRNYHGASSPDLEAGAVPTVGAVRILFEPDIGARVAAMAEGRADLLMERARPDHEPLVASSRVSVRGLPGAQYEHWGLNLLNPHLAVPEVRLALALAIDKEALIAGVFQPLTGPDPSLRPLGNTFWMVDQPAYVDHQSSLTQADIAGAVDALTAAGYIQGPDGIYQHPERGPLRLRVSTVEGDPVREAEQRLLIEQLGAAGFDLVADNRPGGRFFREGPFAPESLAASATGGVEGDPNLWDIAQFSWVGRPWPGGQSGAYRTGSPGNPYGFSNLDFEQEASSCDGEMDDDVRNACYNELDRYVTTLEAGQAGLFMIPLVQRPHLLAWSSQRWQAVPQVLAADGGGPLAVLPGFVPAE